MLSNQKTILQTKSHFSLACHHFFIPSHHVSDENMFVKSDHISVVFNHLKQKRIRKRTLPAVQQPAGLFLHALITNEIPLRRSERTYTLLPRRIFSHNRTKTYPPCTLYKGDIYLIKLCTREILCQCMQLIHNRTNLTCNAIIFFAESLSIIQFT